MLLNFSNHPSKLWSMEQIDAGREEYGEIQDLPFPSVSPKANVSEIQSLAKEYVLKILAMAEGTKMVVHIMGEMTFTYSVVSQLKKNGIVCIASTTERNTEMAPNGKKISDFHFVQFREY